MPLPGTPDPSSLASGPLSDGMGSMGPNLAGAVPGQGGGGVAGAIGGAGGGAGDAAGALGGAIGNKMAAPFKECPNMPESGAICPVAEAEGKTCPWAEKMFGGFQFESKGFDTPDLACGEAPDVAVPDFPAIDFVIPDYSGQLAELFDALLDILIAALGDLWAMAKALAKMVWDIMMIIYNLFLLLCLSIVKIYNKIMAILGVLSQSPIGAALGALPTPGKNPFATIWDILCKVGKFIYVKIMTAIAEALAKVPTSITVAPPDIPKVDPGAKLPLPDLGGELGGIKDKLAGLQDKMTSAGQPCSAPGAKEAEKAEAAKQGESVA